MPDQGGSFINDVYLITTCTGEELVLKIENPHWEVRKTLNEVSAIHYVGQNTKIPVPSIIKYHNQIESSPLGAEYILMNRLKGKALNLVIDEVYSNKKVYHQVLNDLADVIAQLHSISFKCMGNVENKNDELVIVSPIEFPESIINKPCHKFSEYAFAWLTYYTEEMKRLKNAHHPSQRHFCLLIPRLENILRSKNFSVLDNPEDLFVYCHQDFVMKNILIDQDRISGILDWEWSGPALAEFEIQTGFDFLQTEEDRELFEKLMAERGFPQFFRPIPQNRQLFYELIGSLYSLISCYEWVEGKLDHSAKFLAQKLEQRMVKQIKNFDIENFANQKTEIIEKMLINFENLQENTNIQPIAFFGLSGAGKTTLAHGLVDLFPDQFCLLPITTSRAPRDDDDPCYTEFLSESDFISALDKGCFALSWQQDGNYYGYRSQHFENTKKYPIMTCSLSAIQKLKNYGAITILIKGDCTAGLEARGSQEVTKKRMLINKKNTDLYLNQSWFKENTDIEHEQIWGDIQTSVQNLYSSIKNLKE